MPTLLGSLRSGETRRRRGWTALALLLVAGLVAAALGSQRLDRHRAVRACAAEGDRIDELWSDQAREAARAGLLATELPYAPTVADKVMPWLDVQAQAWREHARAACMHATVDMSWDEATHARARWCLEDRRLELEILVGALIDADEQIVWSAVQIAAELSPLEPCTDERSLHNIELPDPQRQPQLEDLHRELARVTHLEDAGKYAEGLPLSRELSERAEALGWAPMTASARVRESSLLARLGEYEEAEALAQRAYFEAAEVEAWEQAARAASSLTDIVGSKLARTDEGLMWAEHATVALAHTGETSDLREAGGLVVLATIHRARGDYEEAEDMLQRALATTEAALGPKHPKLVKVLTALGNFYVVRGDYERAKPLLLRALAIWEQHLGQDHPEVAKVLNSLGVLHYYMHADDEAKAYYERGLLICEKNLGPDHPLLASTLSNLGLVYWVEKDYERSRDFQQRALAIRERAFDPTHPEVAATLTNLGLVHEGLGDLDQAAQVYEQVLVIHEQRWGPSNPRLGPALENLASVHMTLGQHEQALAYLRRARPLKEKKHGPSHPEMAFVFTNMADALRALEQREEAIALVERALTIREQHEVGPQFLAASQWTLAQLLWEASPEEGRDRARARSMAELALEGYLAPDHDEEQAEVTRWLAEHPL